MHLIISIVQCLDQLGTVDAFLFEYAFPRHQDLDTLVLESLERLVIAQRRDGYVSHKEVVFFAEVAAFALEFDMQRFADDGAKTLCFQVSCLAAQR